MSTANKMVFAGVALLTLGMFASCKGRTMSNMEPTGDTVEVQIAPLPSDTIAAEAQ